VLALQRSAGNAAVTDLVTRRGARGIHRAPLPDKDNEAIVARLHEAMAGWGTDEEAIFVSLQKLNKDAAAIAKVKELYKKTASSELEGDIRDEMSGTELALACELLGVGGKAVGATPGNDAEILAVVKRLHSAMDQWGTDEEAIYAALIPFNRDPAKVEKLKKAYTDEFKGGLTGKGLEADIRDEMSSDELAYALYLMNAPPPRTAGASAVPNKPGTEDHAGKVAGGDVSVHTDVDYDPSEGGATRAGSRSATRAAWPPIRAGSSSSGPRSSRPAPTARTRSSA
jgi:hypothetical protein